MRFVPIEAEQQEIPRWNKQQRQQRCHGKAGHHKHGHGLPKCTTRYRHRRQTENRGRRCQQYRTQALAGRCDDRFTQIPVHGSDQAVDVTGAGDTVLAAYTLALACGASLLEAAHIANIAGGLVVMKRGTATISRQELLDAIRGETSGAGS